jgi:hypothetical protein
MHKVLNNVNPKKFDKNHMCYSYEKTRSELCDFWIMRGLQDCILTQNATTLYYITI